MHNIIGYYDFLLLRARILLERCTVGVFCRPGFLSRFLSPPAAAVFILLFGVWCLFCGVFCAAVSLLRALLPPLRLLIVPAASAVSSAPSGPPTRRVPCRPPAVSPSAAAPVQALLDEEDPGAAGSHAHPV